MHIYFIKYIIFLIPGSLKRTWGWTHYTCKEKLPRYLCAPLSNPNYSCQTASISANSGFLGVHPNVCFFMSCSVHGHGHFKHQVLLPLDLRPIIGDRHFNDVLVKWGNIQWMQNMLKHSICWTLTMCQAGDFTGFSFPRISLTGNGKLIFR